MQIAGTGITTFTAKIKDDFIPKTTYALTWSQLSDGSWYSVDRGSGADTYDADIRLYGTESVINDFIDQIEANRVAGSNVISLSSFNAQEHIFGADINYSGALSCTAIMQRRTQKTWKGFGVALRLSLLSPSFIGGSGSLPPLRLLDVGYDADADYEIVKFDSYNRSFSYQDHASDDGSFAGVFTFTDAEMIALRRFIAVNRGSAFSRPDISGVDFPFGRLSPYDLVNLIAFEDMGMLNMLAGTSRWKAKLTLAPGGYAE